MENPGDARKRALDFISVLIIWARVMRELAWNVSETAHTLRRLYGRRAQSLGVTRAQWRVLKHLALEPGLKQVELAERMDVEPITLCRPSIWLRKRSWGSAMLLWWH